MSVDRVDRVAANRDSDRRPRPGAYSYNSFPDDDYQGPVLVIAALKLGDRAHLEVSNGLQRRNGKREPEIHYGRAGYLVMAWSAWTYWRDQIGILAGARIAEVDNPTTGQLDQHLPKGGPLVEHFGDLTG